MSICNHVWLYRANVWKCECGSVVNAVDASTGGELDFRDNATWFKFINPIRESYIKKKREENRTESSGG